MADAPKKSTPLTRSRRATKKTPGGVAPDETVAGSTPGDVTAEPGEGSAQGQPSPGEADRPEIGPLLDTKPTRGRARRASAAPRVKPAEGKDDLTDGIAGMVQGISFLFYVAGRPGGSAVWSEDAEKLGAQWNRVAQADDRFYRWLSGGAKNGPLVLAASTTVATAVAAVAADRKVKPQKETPTSDAEGLGEPVPDSDTPPPRPSGPDGGVHHPGPGPGDGPDTREHPLDAVRR